MKKKTALILITIISLAGSFATFYVSNLLFSDVGNLFYGFHDLYILATLPGFMLVPELVLATLYIVRVVIKPAGRKQICRLYTVLLAVFAAMGFAGAIASGTVVYGSFLAPYPFPGYTLEGLIFQGALMVLGIILRIRCEKLPEDSKRQKITFGYVVYTLVLAVLIFFTYNRLGALLWAPVYVHWPTLYMTFPFYVSLLLPAGVLANNLGFVFGQFEKMPKKRTSNLILLTVLTVVLGAAVFIIGWLNTQFISVISPALALERLATKPIDVIVQFGLLIIFEVIFLVMSGKDKKAPGTAK